MNEGVPHTVTDCMGRIGETLKKARELREIGLREISDATKINLRYLEAIETNQFDVLPGGVFNKGFIRAYANYIGLDGQAMVDNYVHDIEAGPDDSSGPEPAPSGLHRPTEIPHRRSAPLHHDGTEPEASTHPSLETTARKIPAPLHLTALQEVPPERADSTPPAGDPNVLPRIAWLIAATGLLFCILVAWKYIAYAPPAPVPVEQANLPQPSSAGPSPSTPAPGTDDEGSSQSADVEQAAIDEEAPSAGNDVMIASAASPADDATATKPPGSASSAADDTTATQPPGPILPVARDDPPPPPAEPKSLLAEEGDRGMTMVITARTATRVRVICDGRETTDRKMRRGDVESLVCEQLIRLSAPDASSIRLAINGSACQPLGAPGSRLFGYVIRADDYRTLCPDLTEGTDVTR